MDELVCPKVPQQYKDKSLANFIGQQDLWNIDNSDLQNLHNLKDYLAGTLCQMGVWQAHFGLIYA